MSTQAFARFFLFLSLLNIPVFLFFGSGSSVEFTNVTDLFAMLSMGNIGQSAYQCQFVKFSDLHGKDPAALGYNSQEQQQ